MAVSKPNSDVPKKVIIIDDDEDIVRMIETNFKKESIYSVEGYDNSKVAWEAIEKNYYDSFIIDWKMPEVSGLALLNRIRQLSNHMFTPVLIMTGFLDLKDFRLLDEYPFIALIEKPFTPLSIMSKLDELQNEYHWFLINQASIEGKIKNFHSDSKSVLSLIRGLLSRSDQHGALALAVGRYYFGAGKLVEARAVFEAILRINPQSLSAMTYLGKICLSERKYTDAASILERAHKTSPMNLERVCLLGDVCLNTNDFTKAQVYFAEAAKIDPHNLRVISGHHLAENIRNLAVSGRIAHLPQNFAGLLNAVGISLVRTKDFEKGIEHYEMALSYVLESSVKARLAFNLGLGYLRWNRLQDALIWFRKSQDFDDGSFPKAAQYIEKLKKLSFNQVLDATEDEEFDFSIEKGQETSKIPAKDYLHEAMKTPANAKISTPPTNNASEPITESELEFDEFLDESIKN